MALYIYIDSMSVVQYHITISRSSVHKMMVDIKARRQARELRRASKARVLWYTVERDREWPSNPLQPLPYAGTESVSVPLPRKVNSNRDNAKSSILSPYCK